MPLTLINGASPNITDLDVLVQELRPDATAGSDLMSARHQISAKSQKIWTLNDQFRQPFQGGKVMMPRGIQSLGKEAVASILLKLRQFDKFKKDNDPYGEHDFGSFQHDGQRVAWKLDYYDKTMEFGSPDPTNPAVTTRVLAIMLASEY